MSTGIHSANLQLSGGRSAKSAGGVPSRQQLIRIRYSTTPWNAWLPVRPGAVLSGYQLSQTRKLRKHRRGKAIQPGPPSSPGRDRRNTHRAPGPMPHAGHFAALSARPGRCREIRSEARHFCNRWPRFHTSPAILNGVPALHSHLQTCNPMWRVRQTMAIYIRPAGRSREAAPAWTWPCPVPPTLAIGGENASLAVSSQSQPCCAIPQMLGLWVRCRACCQIAHPNMESLPPYNRRLKVK